MALGTLAFEIGRRIGMHPAASWLFCRIEKWLPLDRIARRGSLVAFHHPRPTQHPHVLIVPTTPVASLVSHRKSEPELAVLIWEMVELARGIAPQLPPAETWQLVINGGTRQHIGQLHGHLLHGASRAGQDSLLVHDPADDMTAWRRIFAGIANEATTPGSGYSLFIRWSTNDIPMAGISRNTRT